MTEREYIDATNLAKIRTALAIIHDFLPMEAKDEADELEAAKALRRIEERLNSRVKVSTR